MFIQNKRFVPFLFGLSKQGVIDRERLLTYLVLAIKVCPKLGFIPIHTCHGASYSAV